MRPVTWGGPEALLPEAITPYMDDDLPDAPPSVRVEVRCPEPVRRHGGCSPGKLFTVLYLAGDQPSYIQPDNLIEMYCLDCKRQLLAAGRDVRRVLHRYNFAGELVDTLIEENI